jgi:hypothetical protein
MELLVKNGLPQTAPQVVAQAKPQAKPQAAAAKGKKGP